MPSLSFNSLHLRPPSSHSRPTTFLSHIPFLLSRLSNHSTSIVSFATTTTFLYHNTMAQPQPSTPPTPSAMATFSLWHLKSLSYAPQERCNLILALQNALREIDREVTRGLAEVQSTEYMVVVTYVRWTFFPSLFPLPTVHSSTFHSSDTASELHWTSRIFASPGNGDSVYLGGLHVFPLNSSSCATFRCRDKDRRSVWKQRTFAVVEAYELTADTNI
jgi:hypothetical protein